MSNIPLIFVTGSHYDIGYQTARTYRSQVLHYYDHLSAQLAKYEAFYATKVGKSFCDGLLVKAQARFPHFMEELKGISDGSGIDLLKVKLVHLDRQLSIHLQSYGKNSEESPLPIGCSDFHVNTEKETLIGHNEDWEWQTAGQDVLLCARIDPYTSSDGRRFEAEKFVVHTWPGLLAGMNSGFNHHGMVFSINHLYPKAVETGRTADLFLSRNLLTAKDIDDVVKILTDEGSGAATGFSANIGFVGKDKLWNVEVAASTGKPRSLVDKIEVIKKTTKGKTTGSYGHFNNYEHLETSAQVLDMSVSRKGRFNSLPPPTDFATVCSMLGDHNTSVFKYAIYQEVDKDIEWATVASVVFDIVGQRMTVFRGHPVDSRPAATVPFSILQD